MSLSLVLAAAFGGCCRFAFSNGLARFWQKPFPLPTLLVNWTGCYLMGWLWAGYQLNQLSDDNWRLLALATLGSFTTVSSFSLHSVQLWQGYRKYHAVSYVMLSVVGCILLLWLGSWQGRFWW